MNKYKVEFTINGIRFSGVTHDCENESEAMEKIKDCIVFTKITLKEKGKITDFGTPHFVGDKSGIDQLKEIFGMK